MAVECLPKGDPSLGEVSWKYGESVISRILVHFEMFPFPLMVRISIDIRGIPSVQGDNAEQLRQGGGRVPTS